MAVVKPFYCVRPAKELAGRVAALPYDVYSRKEARQAAKEQEFSFLKIDRPETQFPEDADMYSETVYRKAKQLLEQWVLDGVFIEEKEQCFYIYRLTMNGRSQTGVVSCCSIDDYLSGAIKKHENTREEKERDRICHIDITDAHTGPIFLTYRAEDGIAKLVDETVRQKPLYDFVSEDGIGHTVWKVSDSDLISKMEQAFEKIPVLYIADGHHRAASGVKVGLKRRKEHPGYTGQEPFNFFLAVLFPDEELEILPYNRVVKDLNGLDKEQFLKLVREKFEIEKIGAGAVPGQKGRFGMFLEGEWYMLTAKEESVSTDPVKGLDVSILQDYLLAPILGITDPRTDSRIEFIGGIRGIKELERRVDQDMKAAFSMYPTSMEELLNVADAGLLMPPKSTWFEPKLRSGLFIHRLSVQD
ncbi:MAG: DUF1015 domain-containing protein [Lachnospiraceae bacterium]